MNSKEFVQAIIEVVRDATISDTLENLKKPTGRSPHKEDIELSQWYSSLSKEDADKIAKIITITVDASVFGVFAVFDGVRAIEDHGEGELELTFNDTQGRTRINDPSCEYLHDIYNSLR